MFDPYSTSSSNYNSTPSQHHPSPSNTSIPLSSLTQQQLEFFLNQGYTKGLLRSLLKLKKSYFQRCWIIDNGSNMLVEDSHVIVINNTNSKNGNIGIDDLDGVSRWKELLDCLGYQVWVSSNLNLSMRFALLNQTTSKDAVQYFTMGEHNQQNILGINTCSQEQEIHRVGQILKNIQPNGPTNLSKQLVVLYRYVSSLLPHLQSTGKKVSIVIATQGLPTNDQGETNVQVIEEFMSSLKCLHALPITITIRLCTDDQKVFDFYNSTIDVNIDCVDVLDDYFGEALEVYLKNPWLTYGLSLHRFRETGFHHQAFDNLDEQLLTLDELYDFCSVMFDIKESTPHPRLHWEGFLKDISLHMKKEKLPWNPVSKRFSPWIDIVQLRTLYEKDMKSKHSHQQHPSKPLSTQSQPIKCPLSIPVDNALVKNALLTSWALQPPSFQTLRQLPELLASIQNTLPPAFGIEEHSYFEKWKPLSLHALLSGGKDVIKRAQRKAQFLLHPDKLPKDLTESQSFICKLIWDILADSWDRYNTD